MDWENYIDNYPDLKYLNTREKAINHWETYGRIEGRNIKFHLYLLIHGTKNPIHGIFRFGNILFFTFITDFIAKNNDLPMIYPYQDKIEKLGIKLFTEGTTVYNQDFILNDQNVSTLLENPIINKNIIKINNFMQVPETARYIKQLINNNKDSILKKNPYHTENNNLFIHVRLGDITDKLNEPFEYYDKAIKQINFDKGFISSDTVSHDICKRLIEKYNLTVFEGCEVDTIQFGSICRHIVLSLGTFSWFIGAFSFDGNIYYPEKKDRWHGDIFVFSEWNKVNLK